MTLLGSASGEKTTGTDFFTSDITPNREGNIVIHIAVATTCVLKYTLDGTNYVEANNGVSLIAGKGYQLKLAVKSDDAFNLKQDTGTVTVTFCRVHTAL